MTTPALEPLSDEELAELQARADERLFYVNRVKVESLLSLIAEVRAGRAGDAKRERQLADCWAKLRDDKRAIREAAWDEGNDATGPYAENPYRKKDPTP